MSVNQLLVSFSFFFITTIALAQDSFAPPAQSTIKSEQIQPESKTLRRAQITFDLLGSTFSGTRSSYSYEQSQTSGAGITGTMDIGGEYFVFETGFKYLYFSTKYNYDLRIYGSNQSFQSQYRQTYIGIPLIAKFYTSPTSNAIYVRAGLIPLYFLNSAYSHADNYYDQTQTREGTFEPTDRWSFLVQAGLGARLALTEDMSALVGADFIRGSRGPVPQDFNQMILYTAGPCC